jgi:hypothetical protein
MSPDFASASTLRTPESIRHNHLSCPQANSRTAQPGSSRRLFAPFAGRIMAWRISLVVLIVVGALGRNASAQDAASKSDDQKVKKEFYSAKDRLEAMHTRRTPFRLILR